MARRNPNGYGSVTKLKGNRSRPYVIKVTTYDEDGHGRQVPVDYAATREEANIIWPSTTTIRGTLIVTE